MDSRVYDWVLKLNCKKKRGLFADKCDQFLKCAWLKSTNVLIGMTTLLHVISYSENDMGI